jgi:hypothetical protein
MKMIVTTGCLAFTLLFAGCATTSDRLLDSDQSQLSLRQIQTRAYDTADREFVLVSIITTLQDLGFVIDGADDVLGTVTATKLDRYALKITVTIRPRGDAQMLVRANAQYQLKPVTEAKPYQDFFTALSKDMFLEEQQIE